MKIEHHPEFERMKPYYQMAADFEKGPREIKFGERAFEYLPASEEMAAAEPGAKFENQHVLRARRMYDRFRRRAEVENYPEDVIGKLLGKLFSKPAVLANATPKHFDLLKTICSDGCDHEVFQMRAACEFLRNQHGGIYTSWVREGKESRLIPSVHVFPAMSFTNWEVGEAGGKKGLTGAWITTKRPVDFMVGTKKETHVVPVYRHLFLDDVDGRRVFTIERWEPVSHLQTGMGAEHDLVDSFSPQSYQGELDYLPFTPLWPPMADPHKLYLSAMHPLMEKTLSLYRNSAIYEKALCDIKFTYVVKGYVPNRLPNGDYEEVELVAGADAAWTSEGDQFQANVLEPSGAGITHLKNAMDDKRSAVDKLAQELASAKNLPQTATQANIVNAESGYKLAAASLALSDLVTRTYAQVSKIAALSEDIQASMNKDFNATGLTPQEAGAWADLQDRGKISAETLVNIYAKGEVYEEDFEQQDEVDRISGAKPRLLRNVNAV